MSDYSKSQSSTKQRFSPNLVGGITAIVAVLSPLIIMFTYSGLGELHISVMSIMWRVDSRGFEFPPMDFFMYNLVSSLPWTFLRIVFVVMMIRLYQGKTTKKRTLIIGIVSELWMSVIYYVVSLIPRILNPNLNFIQMFTFPFPMLLVTGLLIMRFAPPIEQTKWIEEEKTRSWWEKQQDEKSKTITEPHKEKR